MVKGGWGVVRWKDGKEGKGRYPLRLVPMILDDKDFKAKIKEERYLLSFFLVLY